MQNDAPTPFGFCQCGCGQKTVVSPKNDRRNSYIKGQPRSFVSGHNSRPHLSRRYIIDPTTGCWLWQGYVDHKGYARWQVNKESRLVHRTLFERQHGPVPDGMQLHHRCETKHCINPDHLTPIEGGAHTLLHQRVPDRVRAEIVKMAATMTTGQIATATGFSATFVRDVRRVHGVAAKPGCPKGYHGASRSAQRQPDR